MIELDNLASSTFRGVDLNVFSIDPEPVKLQEVAQSVIEELDSKIKEKKTKGEC